MCRNLTFWGLWLTLWAQLWSVGRAEACTVFAVLPPRPLASSMHTPPPTFLLAKNFEFFIGDGFVAWNPQGIEKRAHVFDGSPALQWVSQYENVTLNQFGLNLPVGGMNVLGLVVEGQILDSTVYPRSNGLPSVNELQFIQYLLDTANSVAEAIKKLRGLRVVSIARGLHWFIADRSGQCVVAEFSKGQLSVHDASRFRVLTNAPYRLSVDARKNQLVGQKPSEMDYQICSYERAVRAHDRLEEQLSSSAAAMDYTQFSFSLLQDVLQERLWKWSVVYDVPARKIFLRAPLKVGAIDTSISLPDLDMAERPHVWRFASVEGRALTSSDFISNPAEVHDYHCSRVLTARRLKLPDEILEAYKKFPHGVELSP